VLIAASSVNVSAVSGFDLNHWVTSIVIAAAQSRFKSKMALSESFNHTIIEQACNDLGGVLELIYPSGIQGSFFSASKVQAIEAYFFKTLPISEAWSDQLPAFICSEIERMLSFVEKSDKAAAFETFSTVLRIMPLLLLRDTFEEVDAMNKQGKWFQAFVIHATASVKKIHFMGWQKSHDEDIPADRFDTHIRPRSAACEIGPRGKETSEAVRQVYGIEPLDQSPPAAAAADADSAAAAPDAAAINNPVSSRFLKYAKGFGQAAQTSVRSFFSQLQPARAASFAVELLAFARVSLLKYSEMFNFELLELIMCEGAAAFTTAISEVIVSRDSSLTSSGCQSLFSKIEGDITDHGRRLSEGQNLLPQQLKLLMESLSTTARNFLRKVISSMKADILQSELTTLIQTVFSLCDCSGAVSESEAADQRSHIFHLFRIMSEISEHASSPAHSSQPAQSKSKELICRSMNAAVLRCASLRAPEFNISTFESQLVALSVALEWLALTSSGQVQNGTAALPITCQSAHPYSDAVLENTHDVRIPGAIALKIHFNKKSETHSEAHCLTFTSGSLSKPQVYSKRTWAGVGTAPKLVIDGDSFTAVFDSNGGGSKWGYSFTVTPVFPDLSSLLLLPLRAAIAALCFGSSHALKKSEPDRAVVGTTEAPCPVVSLIDEVRSQSAVGQRFQHLIRGPNPVFRVFKDSQSTLGSLLAQAHATHHVHLALPHVSTFEFECLNVIPILFFIQLLSRVMTMCSTLNPSSSVPQELIASTHLAQTCMEYTVGTSISSHATSNSTDSTPQKLTAAAFDALCRENKNLIERVIMRHHHQYCTFAESLCRSRSHPPPAATLPPTSPMATGMITGSPLASSTRTGYAYTSKRASAHQMLEFSSSQVMIRIAPR
jgi:hypothetical protein